MVFFYIIGTGNLVHRSSILETFSLGQYFLEVFYAVVVLAESGHEDFAFVDVGIGDSTEFTIGTVSTCIGIALALINDHTLFRVVVTLPYGCRSDGTSYSHGGVRCYYVKGGFV